MPLLLKGGLKHFSIGINSFHHTLHPIFDLTFNIVVHTTGRLCRESHGELVERISFLVLCCGYLFHDFGNCETWEGFVLIKHQRVVLPFLFAVLVVKANVFVALSRALRAIHSCQSKELSNLAEQDGVDLLEQVC
jgi:hypothetical protein